MISFAQAIILGGLQGVTELFPISSLGHTVLLPHILGWNIDQSAPDFVAFIVATHLATAVVLFVFYWKEWIAIIRAVLGSLFTRSIDSADAKFGWLLVVATIPAGIIGLLLQKKIEGLFASATIVSVALILNGGMLLLAEFLKEQKQSKTELARLSFPRAFYIGLMQALALIPGFSRTGAAMTGSLMFGLEDKNAAKMAFMLATPIIAAAAVLKVPLLFKDSAIMPQAIVGMVVAGICAYLSVRFLTKYFENNTLRPYGYYCIAVGVVAFLLTVV